MGRGHIRPLPASEPCGLERDIVVRARWGGVFTLRGGEARISGATGAAATSATEEAHVARDDLGDVLLVAVLVVVAAVGDAALDIDLAALGEILTAGLSLLAPDDDVVPLGLLLLLALLIGPALGGGDGELRDRPAARGEAHL